MEKIIIGINQRIPMNMLELALRASIEGEATTDYFRELAAMEYNGQNRIGKTVVVLNRLTKRNPLLPYLLKNKEMVEQMLRNKNDRPLLLTAIICSSYSFGFDVVTVLGKYFHVQDEITTELITKKMAEKYGSNRSLPNALYCILPMLIEAGLIARPVAGVYKNVGIKNATEAAIEVFKQSYSLNNPNYADGIRNPYFEFIN